jgi:hypothetical protein
MTGPQTKNTPPAKRAQISREIATEHREIAARMITRAEQLEREANAFESQVRRETR